MLRSKQHTGLHGTLASRQRTDFRVGGMVSRQTNLIVCGFFLGTTEPYHYLLVDTIPSNHVDEVLLWSNGAKHRRQQGKPELISS